MTWDNWRFQDSLLKRIEDARRYRWEHEERIRRKQPNGKQWMVGEKNAEIAILSGLVGGNTYRTPADVVAKLEQMRDEPQSPSDHASKEEAEGFRRGWEMTIRAEIANMTSVVARQDQEGQR
ncbi:MAG: hypothetical protein EOQ39_03565 [Mesorhizobium sp.]|uniref:hypothetical protein n=1 Tax=Mesorhizobium sp. TaxID=1871066 RepID=UPI000FE73F65|nr:hypothetical protein [Mesorhizobium sp.]RWB08988.1 MAG: hypothetical protein EOQ37_05720 [Mesorhizobium sp.]RWB17409.1 MAG: hypothetical protein EOQ39_03565 [Mesorhizobium sp.]